MFNSWKENCTNSRHFAVALCCVYKCELYTHQAQVQGLPLTLERRRHPSDFPNNFWLLSNSAKFSCPSANNLRVFYEYLAWWWLTPGYTWKSRVTLNVLGSISKYKYIGWHITYQEYSNGYREMFSRSRNTNEINADKVRCKGKWKSKMATIYRKWILKIGPHTNPNLQLSHLYSNQLSPVPNPNLIVNAYNCNTNHILNIIASLFSIYYPQCEVPGN